MKADSAGYGLGGRSPSGRCILEMRGSVCKAALTVQDIRPNVNYKAYIVEKDKGHGKAPRGVTIGNVTVDAQGRGELKKEFDGAFAGKLFFDDVGVVALVASKASSSDTPLVGFENDNSAKTYMWKNFVDTTKEQVTKPTPPDEEPETQITEPEVQSSESKEHSIEPEVWGAEIDSRDHGQHEVAFEPDPPFSEPEPPQVYNAANDPDPVEPELLPEPESDLKPEPEPTEPRQSHVHKQNNPAALNEHGEIESIFANNVELRPFVNRNKNHRWVRASLREFAVLPVEFWRIMNSPLVALCNEKYGHLILGRNKRSPSKLMIGVPSTYDGKHLPEARTVGFTRFECCEDKEPAEGDHGYWMLESRIP